MLIAAREHAHLTQKAVAALLGKHQSFVAKYEGGERRLDVIEFIQICQAMGVRPDRLIKKLL
jgi:transcriptional regulator with XRE-family HTH domain